jgi:beta-lactamase regulating signal transducer with metallopeptidase domain
MIGWSVDTLVGSTLLMLLALAARRPMARAFGPHAAYGLWLLPALRMVLPPLPGWHPLYVPVAHTDAPATIGIVDPATAARLAGPLPVETVSHPPAALAGMAVQWPALLIGLWLAGALAFAAVQAWRYHRFVRAALADGEVFSRTAGIDVVISRHVDGPMAAGIVRRRIFLPADFLARYAPAERRLALLHEGAHHDRGDMIANMAGLAVLALHWWNPVAHFAWRAFRADQELACDATVLAGAGGGERADYGRAVLKSACLRTPAAACAMNHKSQLKDRIAMMKDRHFGRTRLALGGTLVAATIGVGLLATASGAAEPPAPPALPAPPAVPAPPSGPAAPVAPTPPTPPAPPSHATRAEAGQHAHHSQTASHAKETDAVVADIHREIADAHREMAEANREAEREIARARREHGAMVDQAVAEARRSMAADCRAKGKTVAESAEWTTPALCGENIDAMVHKAMADARAGVLAAKDISDADRARALQALDKADAERNRSTPN